MKTYMTPDFEVVSFVTESITDAGVGVGSGTGNEDMD